MAASRGWRQNETLLSAIVLAVAMKCHLVSTQVCFSIVCKYKCRCRCICTDCCGTGLICLLAFGNLDCSEKDLERGMATD